MPKRSRLDATIIGTVTYLAIKPERGAPMAPRQTVQLEAMLGIDGDVHASPWTPRQVLLQTDDAGGSPGGYRENFRLAMRGTGAWPLASGSLLQLGEDGALLRVCFPCEPCSKGAEYAGMELAALSEKWKQRAPRGTSKSAHETRSSTSSTNNCAKSAC